MTQQDDFDKFYQKAAAAMEEIGREIHNEVDSQLLQLHQKAETIDSMLVQLSEKADKLEAARLEAKVDAMRARRLKERKMDKVVLQQVMQGVDDYADQRKSPFEAGSLLSDSGIRAFAELHGLASIAKKQQGEL